MQKDLFTDLGLSYYDAAHGVQSVKAFELNGAEETHKRKYEIKHIRTGIDMTKAEMFGLATLLMDKGVFTPEEYAEYLRLAMNTELAREQELHGVDFR